jgi:hypothetical protein
VKPRSFAYLVTALCCLGVCAVVLAVAAETYDQYPTGHAGRHGRSARLDPRCDGQVRTRSMKRPTCLLAHVMVADSEACRVTGRAV